MAKDNMREFFAEISGVAIDYFPYIVSKCPVCPWKILERRISVCRRLKLSEFVNYTAVCRLEMGEGIGILVRRYREQVLRYRAHVFIKVLY